MLELGTDQPFVNSPVVGSSRIGGAFQNREIAADNPVNTKRREFSLSAFLRYPTQYQPLTSTPSKTENSLTLWLTHPSELTAGCVRTPKGTSCEKRQSLPLREGFRPGVEQRQKNQIPPQKRQSEECQVNYLGL